MTHTFATASDFFRLRLTSPGAHEVKYKVTGDCATCHTTILDIEKTATRDGKVSHYDCFMRSNAGLDHDCHVSAEDGCAGCPTEL